MSTRTRRRRGARGRVMWESTDLTFDRCACGGVKRRDNALCAMCRLDAADAYDAEWAPDPRADIMMAYTFADQVGQYPVQGPPGIAYFKGVLDDEHYVDCLLWRDAEGRVRGILNHYPMDVRVDGVLVERKGNVNILVDPAAQRQGIGTALLHAADRRWHINWRQQSWTAQGRALYASFVRSKRS